MRSTPMTVSPRSSRWSARCEPMKPATPVTRELGMHFLPLRRGRRKRVPAQLREQPGVGPGGGFDREVARAALASRCSVLAPERRVAHICPQRGSEGFLVADWHKLTRHPILDQLLDPA